ncbi:30S ribosomal protein S1 [Buchnera aphidicola (Kurisakia onigurumii)]|uniref:30S ribosomal protein S1 n=1 Tax=Buchnera aphidicola TaxID=9 RepID=UPI0031B6E81F
MNTSFSELFEESLKKINIRPGSIIKSKVIKINKDFILVDSGLKSESNIPAEQFKNSKGELEVKLGDIIDVSLDAVEDGFGETLLSREKAKRHAAWLKLEQAYEEKITIRGIINGKVKGGFTVELNEIRAFLPGSLVDIRPIRDTSHLEGQESDFKVIKLDQKRNNVVVSRRAVIEFENIEERNQLLENLQEGLNFKGIVKNLTDYGAFVDLGGVDGLLHITDMAWKRVKHPNEIVSIGDEITVKILKFDKDRTRVSLGLKQLGSDPWMNISERYPEKKKIQGKITNLTDYGCFVEIEEGVEGLVHVSEMDWTNKNIHPSKVVNVNDIVEVMVLDIDEERRRISLGLKQCKQNPWKKFSKNHAKGTQVEGKIKSITDFGIFVGLKGGIDGLVHLSDISWSSTGEDKIKKYNKGEDILTVVLQVDAERERISLGIKQLKEDPFNKFISKNKKNKIINGKITVLKNKNKKHIYVQLEKNVFGILVYLNKLENSINPEIIKIGNDPKYIIGEELKVQIHTIDKKNRIIYVTQIHQEKKKENNKNKQEKKNNIKNNVNNVMTEAFKAAKSNE